MSDEKDRLGDKMRDVEKAREDQWARQRDKELLEKLAKKGTATAAEMHCPKCSKPLVSKTQSGVALMACPAGDGAWIPQASLDLLLKLAK